MSPHQPPPDVRRLLEERASARADRAWERADALRDEIAALGWEVADGPAGSDARPILAAAGPDALDGAARLPLTIVVVAEDHPDDVDRLLRGLAGHPPPMAWELVVVANEPTFDPADVLARAALPIEPLVLASDGRLGWADARTMGLRASGGEVAVLLDTSLEPAGDFATPLLAAFDDPAVGLAGGWGVRSGDMRQFDDAAPGEVDAIEGYCLAVRREALRAVGGFDRRYRWYRNADLDFSFAVRDAGWRAVRTDELPLTRHEHRGWAALPEAERDRLSRRNFYRFLDRWRDRPDLLLGAETTGVIDR